MQLTKYKLGDLIVQRREKNKGYDLPIRGVSREGFIKPKVEEADTSIYNVFYMNDFVFNPARMELNSIALNLDLDKALCSSLYEVFYVKDENVVLPEFLNLHIKRDEFARHCDYIGLGSAREYCRFANIADFDIKIPPIEVQREIVQADRQIKRRMRLNEQMIKKLEATAQALYRKIFVDGIDKDKSPHEVSLFEVANITYGFPFNSELFCNDNTLSPIIRIRDIISNKTDTFTSEHVDKKYEIADGDILIGMDGSFHMTIWCGGFALQNQRIVKIVPNKGTFVSAHQIFFSIYDTIKQLEASIEGTTVAHLSDKDLRKLSIIVASEEIQEKTYSLFDSINKSIIIYKKEILKLTELQSLLLSKMGQ